LLTKLKRRVQSWIAFEARMAYRAGLTPNQISLLGLVLAVASGFLYWASSSHLIIKDSRIALILAVLLLLSSGFCDALDGALARIYGKETIFGGFLDSLLDRYADASIYCGLILGGLCDLSWGLTALVGSILVSYSRARAEAAGVPMETVGLAERADRLMIIAVASILNLMWNQAIRWGIIVLAILTNLTVLQRITHFSRKVKSKH